MKKMVVFFPGAGYGMDSPLLYYADFLFETKGYDRLVMNYEGILCNRELELEEKIRQLREYELERVSQIDFTMYDEVVFLAKSVGTVEAGWLAEKLDIKVQQIFLTPMKEALNYCTGMAKVVIGTADSVYAMYKEYCDKEKVDTLYIKDGNHSLEVVGKPYESIEMLKKVLEFIEKKRYTEEFLD